MALRISHQLSQYAVEGGSLSEFKDWYVRRGLVGPKQKLIGELYNPYSEEEIVHWYNWMKFKEPDMDRANIVKLFQALSMYDVLFLGVPRQKVSNYIVDQSKGTGAIVLSENAPQRFVLILNRELNLVQIAFTYDAVKSQIAAEKYVPFCTRTIDEINWGITRFNLEYNNHVIETRSDSRTVQHITGDASDRFKLTLIETGMEFETVLLTKYNTLALKETSQHTLPSISKRLSLSLEIIQEDLPSSRYIIISETTTFRFSKCASMHYDINTDNITTNTILDVCKWITPDCQSLLLTTGRTTLETYHKITPSNVSNDKYERPDHI